MTDLEAETTAILTEEAEAEIDVLARAIARALAAQEQALREPPEA